MIDILPIHHLNISSVTCFLVSSGLVTVWPIVLESAKISWSLPPLKIQNKGHDIFDIKNNQKINISVQFGGNK